MTVNGHDYIAKISTITQSGIIVDVPWLGENQWLGEKM